MHCDERYDPCMSRAEEAARRAELAAAQARGESREAQKLIVEFVAAAKAKGVAPHPLRATLYGGQSVKTDKVGSYKVMVKAEGKCTLKVYVDKKTATLEVFSFKEPTRYDLLVEEKDGKLTVRRK